MSRFILLFIISLLFLSTPSVASTENQYSVEFIVFTNQPITQQPQEPWTREPLQLSESTLRLSDLLHSGELKGLNSDEKTLHGVMSRLNRLSSYQPLIHTGWIQTLAEDSERVPLGIETKTTNQNLTGTVTLYRGKYLHLDFDLQLSEDNLASPASSTVYAGFNQPSHYRLFEKRRIKRDEIQYYDHPKFGVLAIVKRLNQPEELKPIEDKDTATSEVEQTVNNGV